MKKVYILDACALIAALRGEQGADVAARLLELSSKGEIALRINKVNLLEVYYDTIKQAGLYRADEVFNTIRESTIEIIHEISDRVLREAGRLKASYRLSLADAIALAEAAVQEGILVTSDHHELDVIEQNEPIKLLWIR